MHRKQTDCRLLKKYKSDKSIEFVSKKRPNI